MKSLHTQILGEDYEVKVRKRKELDLPKELQGSCAYLLKQILVEHSNRECQTDIEKDKRTSNTVAHEVFHAYVHESGLDLDEATEERLAVWYETMWRRMNNTILDVLDELGLVDI